ncbi:MAG: tryptophan 2,3-dioxygenase, partial [Actinomycetota bacterium]|nr:tryptophan 2,3-dioxygenase [Actinomycetota bacterium]
MNNQDNTRSLEEGIVTDLSGRMSYGSYLALDELLSLQRPVSVPEHHDELLFIIQHQTSELWMKLMLHELRSAREALRADDLGTMLKRVARIKHILDTMTQQWSVLATLTPTEYAEFRGFLANSSGFQSHQYRAIEFILGNKNAGVLPVFDTDPDGQRVLSDLLQEPTLYDEFLRYLDRQGYDIPTSVLQRDVTKAYTLSPDLIPVFKAIYESATENWRVYEACEEFV